MTEGGFYTVVFHGHPRNIEGNPFEVASEFGKVAVISLGDLSELLNEGGFLIARLMEFESEIIDAGSSAAREYYGHVSPAIARFRSAIARAEGRT